MQNNYIISYSYISNPQSLKDFELYQIGRIFCNENTVYDNHFHKSYYEFTVVTEGEGTLYTNNMPVKVQKGDIYLSFLGDTHRIESSVKNPLQYDFCSLHPKDSELQAKLSLLGSRLVSADSRLFHSNRISYLLPLAINEMSNLDRDFAKDIVNSVLWEMTVFAERILSKSFSESLEQISDKKILCYQVMDYINANLGSITALKELSQRFGYSYNYLSATFKEVTSQNLIDFYNMQRLTFAKELILEKKLTLEEIAREVNFSTAYALSRAFKKYFRLSPAQYRKHNE